jgi:hypothetical protein
MRVILGAFSLLGAALGAIGALLQTWALHLRLETLGASGFFLAVSLGSVLGPCAGFRLRARGPAVRRLFLASGILAAAALLWLSQVVQAVWITPAAAALGVSVGALGLGLAILMEATVGPPRAAAMIGVAGIFFCSGALASCLLLYFFLDLLGLPLLLVTLAIPFAAFFWQVRRSRFFEFLSFESRTPAISAADFTPKSALLALALLLESGIHWTLAGWLAFYLAHRFGMTTSDSLAILALFWAAVSGGRIAVERWAGAASSFRWLLYANGSVIVGSLFLLKTADLSGTVMGALLSGGGLGVLQPLTRASLAGPYPRLQQRVVSAYFAANLSGGLLIAWAVGRLAATLGIDLVLWSALGGSILVFILLGIVLVESKLDERVSLPSP